MKKLCKIFVAALEKSAILYSLYYLYISKIKIGVAINIGKIEGKRAVIDYQRFNRGHNEGITRANAGIWRAKHYKWQ